MSYVTDVVVCVPLDFRGLLKEHLEAFTWGVRSARVGELDKGLAGGSKVMGTCIYAAGFNYLPVDSFIVHLAAFDWPYPEASVVCLWPEDGSCVVWTPSRRDHQEGLNPMRIVAGTEETSR